MNEFELKIVSVLKPPIRLGFMTSLECPCCEFLLDETLDIDLNTFEVDNETKIHCENCNAIIKFKIVLNEQ